MSQIRVRMWRLVPCIQFAAHYYAHKSGLQIFMTHRKLHSMHMHDGEYYEVYDL